MPNKGRNVRGNSPSAAARHGGAADRSGTSSSSPDDDAAAFAEAVRGARKLAGTPLVSPLVSPSPSPSPAARPNAVASRPCPVRAHGAPSARDLKWEVSEAGEAWTVRADGVDARVVRRMRAGQVPIDGALDLHGLTRVRAVATLDRFLAASLASGRRCVMVIHGRGLHSGDQGPTVRDAVRVALTDGNHAGFVLACCPAPPARGGAGATLILLRR